MTDYGDNVKESSESYPYEWLIGQEEIPLVGDVLLPSAGIPRAAVFFHLWVGASSRDGYVGHWPVEQVVAEFRSCFGFVFPSSFFLLRWSPTTHKCVTHMHDSNRAPHDAGANGLIVSMISLSSALAHFSIPISEKIGHRRVSFWAKFTFWLWDKKSIPLFR